ncbi:unnamed protein product, partial [Amoebophrya sp. A120]|eukprot:GSA120T00012550001.1
MMMVRAPRHFVFLHVALCFSLPTVHAEQELHAKCTVTNQHGHFWTSFRHAPLMSALPSAWVPMPPDIPEKNIQPPNHALPVERVPVGFSDSIHSNEIADLYDVLFEYNRLWAKQRWMGTITMQNPMDAWVIQELLFDCKPDVIIETGTMNGGGALFYASLMRMYSTFQQHLVEDEESDLTTPQMNTRTNKKPFVPQVITIGNLPLDDQSYGWHWDTSYCSLETNACRNATSNPLWKQQVTFIRGDAVSEEVFEKVKDKLSEIACMKKASRVERVSHAGKEEDESERESKGKATTAPTPSSSEDLKIMVVLDSTHHYAHVRKELALYSRFVTPDQYLLVQDTHLDKLRNLRNPESNWEGAFAAIREWFEYSSYAKEEFKVDQRREYFIYTQHKNGYLKRIRLIAAADEMERTQ